MSREKRIEQLSAYLKNSPDDTFLNYALAMEFVSAGADEKARETLEKLTKNSPEYTATYYHLGKLLERAGENEEAVRIYQTGIDITRQNREQHALSELQSALNELQNPDW
jgi:uncharacterized protein HemY